MKDEDVEGVARGDASRHMEDVTRGTAVGGERCDAQSVVGDGVKEKWLIEECHIDAADIGTVGDEGRITETGEGGAMREIVDDTVVLYFHETYEGTGFGAT